MLDALFKRNGEVRAIGQADAWGSWPGDFSKSWSGEVVTQDSALQLLTVYGCVRLITDSVATLPVDVYRTSPDGRRVEVEKPAWMVYPTIELDFTAWCTQVLSSLLLHGNAYVAVTRNPRGQILELPVLDPGVVSVRLERGRKAFYIGGAEYDGEIVHIPGLMLPGSVIGASPLEYARQSIGLGLAANKFGAEFFENEGNMPGVIEMPRPAQPETLKTIAETWRRKRTKGGRGLPGVLQDGAVWKPTGVTNEQAQFLATRRYTAAEIAGQMFLLDPSELGIGVEGTSLTYANLEQRSIRRYETCQPWIVRVERALESLLLGESVRFNVNARLRGDTLQRAQTYELLAGIGALTVDEIRELEDRSPLSPEDRKQSRAWQEVGLPALVQDGLMTVNEARAQLGLGPIAGGDVPRDPGDGVDAGTPSARSVEADMDAELRAALMAMAARGGGETHLHLPDSLQVEMRQEPIVVPAPVVNVPPAQVTVNVEPTPVTVNVDPTPVTVSPAMPAVTVMNVPEDSNKSITFVRDAQGRIVGATKGSG